jgi:hypothetical protein
MFNVEAIWLTFDLKFARLSLRRFISFSDLFIIDKETCNALHHTPSQLKRRRWHLYWYHIFLSVYHKRFTLQIYNDKKF